MHAPVPAWERRKHGQTGHGHTTPVSLAAVYSFRQL